MTATENNSFFSRVVGVGKHGLVYGLGILLSRSITFILVPVYTYHLTPDDYGILEILFRFAEITSIFIGAGLGLTIIRFYTLEEGEERKNAVVTTALSFVSVIGLTLVALLSFRAEFLAHLLFSNYDHINLIRMTLAICLGEALFIIPLTFMQARVSSGLFVTFSIMKLVLGLALNIYFVAVIEQGMRGVLTANLITVMVSAAVVLVWSFRQTGMSVRLDLLKKMLKFGLPLVPGSLFLFILNSGDRFFLQKYTTDAVLGLYSLGYKLGTIIMIMILVPFNKVWSVYVFKISKQDNCRSIYRSVFKLLMFGYVALGLGLSLFSRELVEIASAVEYLEAYRIIPLVVLSYLFWTASTFFDLGFYLTDKTVYKPFLMGFGAGLILLLYWWLIPIYDMYGAAFATVAGFGTFAAATYLTSQRVYPLKHELGRTGLMLGAAIGLTLVGYLSADFGRVLGIAYKLVILGLFPVLIGFSGYFSKSEKGYFREFVVSVKARLAAFRRPSVAEEAVPEEEI